MAREEGGVITLAGAIAPRIAASPNIFSSPDGDQFPYVFWAWGMGVVASRQAEIRSSIRGRGHGGTPPETERKS